MDLRTSSKKLSKRYMVTHTQTKIKTYKTYDHRSNDKIMKREKLFSKDIIKCILVSAHLLQSPLSQG
jgi:hypothetical protein